jgi:hypothetical protein
VRLLDIAHITLRDWTSDINTPTPVRAERLRHLPVVRQVLADLRTEATAGLTNQL